VKLVLVGISHHVAPVELRERVAVPLDQAAELSRRLAGETGEAACLSTCNRTELYVVDGAEAEARAVEVLAEVAGLSEEELHPVLYRLTDEAAALHLFRVAAGLDSMVPGEGEILGQVRAAYEAAERGPTLDRLFRQALHAGKKVRNETAIGESPSSVSSAAAALAEQLFGDLAGRRTLVIGGGEMGELAVRNLGSRGAEIALVASRTVDRAVLMQELEHADVVVSSTSSAETILHRDDVERVMQARRGRPLFLIDIAVPRDLDPAIHELEGCYLYDIDDLEAVVAEGLAGRRREASRAEAIVAEEAEQFRAWQASREVVPAIASLRARAEEIRAGELARARGRLSESERLAVESITSQIVNKLLHLPTVRLKEAAAGADGSTYADAVTHLFGLGEDADPPRLAGK